MGDPGHFRQFCLRHKTGGRPFPCLQSREGGKNGQVRSVEHRGWGTGDGAQGREKGHYGYSIAHSIKFRIKLKVTP